YPTPAPDRRRSVRHRHDVGRRAGPRLPTVQPPRVPHGAHPPPLRAHGVAGDDGDRALLDPRRTVHRPGHGRLLRRLPGLARRPVFTIARDRGVPLVGEVELAARWADRPIVAVTGTNGKTTVTGLTTDMLVASGIAAVAAGNIGVPLAEAAAGPAEMLVVEVSS